MALNVVGRWGLRRGGVVGARGGVAGGWSGGGGRAGGGVVDGGSVDEEEVWQKEEEEGKDAADRDLEDLAVGLAAPAAMQQVAPRHSNGVLGALFLPAKPSNAKWASWCCLCQDSYNLIAFN